MATQISYLGPIGTYSHQAALKYFNEDQLEPQKSLESVVESVRTQKCLYGVLPIENSTNGAVYAALEAIENAKTVRILGDFKVPVQHNYYTFGHENPHYIYSHPQVWGQVEEFIAQQQTLREIALVSCSSTAAALEQARSNPDAAAIASAHGGRVAGVQPAFEDISDEPNNATRFVVLGLGEPKREDHPNSSAFLLGGSRGRAIDEEIAIREVPADEVPQLEADAVIIGYSGEWKPTNASPDEQN